MGSLRPTLDVGIPAVTPQTMKQSSQLTDLPDQGTSPTGLNFAFDQYGDETQDTFEERDDAKRRRIARVQKHCSSFSEALLKSSHLGMRHVPKEEDKVRRQDAGLFALHQLQDRMQLHPCREEARPSKRVSFPLVPESQPG